MRPELVTDHRSECENCALNRRILTVTSFRAQYAVSVTLVRNWMPIFVEHSVARGGLAPSTTAVGAAIAAGKFTNMLGQPLAGRVSDRDGRGLFVAVGGICYGLVALAVPLAPAAGQTLGSPTSRFSARFPPYSSPSLR